MSYLTTGQITFVEYSDAISLTGAIASTHAKTQIFSTDGGGVYAPDWVTNNNILTPTVFRQSQGASAIDLMATGTNISNVTWKLKLYTDAVVTLQPGQSNTLFGSVASSAPYALTLNKNCMTTEKPSLECTFSCTYTDPSTGNAINYVTSVSFALMRSGGKAVYVKIFEQNGNYVIRNGAVDTSTLTLKFSVFRNGTKDTSVTGIAQWKYRDPGGTWTNNGSAISLTNQDPEAAATKVISAATIDAIKNSRVYRIEFTDNDSEAETSGVVYADEVTILDMTDPYTVEAVVSGGMAFKNGDGTKDVILKLYQAGQEIDTVPGSFKLYRATLTDKNGNYTYFRSSYDLVTTITGSLTANTSQSLIVASTGVSPRNIIAGDLLVLEPGTGNEEIVRVASSYTSGTTIPLEAKVTKNHASGATIKSATKKVGLTDSQKKFSVTGDDIDSIGLISVEVLQ